MFGLRFRLDGNNLGTFFCPKVYSLEHFLFLKFLKFLQPEKRKRFKNYEIISLGLKKNVVHSLAIFYS